MVQITFGGWIMRENDNLSSMALTKMLQSIFVNVDMKNPVILVIVML